MTKLLIDLTFTVVVNRGGKLMAPPEGTQKQGVFIIRDRVVVSSTVLIQVIVWLSFVVGPPITPRSQWVVVTLSLREVTFMGTFCLVRASVLPRYTGDMLTLFRRKRASNVLGPVVILPMWGSTLEMVAKVGLTPLLLLFNIPVSLITKEAFKTSPRSIRFSRVPRPGLSTIL